MSTTSLPTDAPAVRHRPPLSHVLAVIVLGLLALGGLPGVAEASPAIAVDGGGYDAEGADIPEDAEPQVLGTARDVELVSPTPLAVLAGFHQATGGGTEALTPLEASDDAPTPVDVLASRGRGTHPTSAVDIAVPEDEPVLATVDGEVRAVSTYQLYGASRDVIVVIVPDAAPEIEVKVLHLDDAQVEVGERVVAGETVIASRARHLPFGSQIDGVLGEKLPHVHIEVVARG